MLSEQAVQESALTRFLQKTDKHVRSLEELVTALKFEIKATEIEELIRKNDQPVSDYLRGLNAIEKKLTSRNTIKISFSKNSPLVYKPTPKTTDTESVLLNIIIRFIREGSI